MQLERRDEWLALLTRAAGLENDLMRRQALLLAAQRLDEAAASLRQGSLRMMFEGGVYTVVRLAEQFPPEFARTSADVQDVAGYAKWRLWRNAGADHICRRRRRCIVARRRVRGPAGGVAPCRDAGRHRPTRCGTAGNAGGRP